MRASAVIIDGSSPSVHLNPSFPRLPKKRDKVMGLNVDVLMEGDDGSSQR